jgi:hypothetical protein
MLVFKLCPSATADRPYAIDNRVEFGRPIQALAGLQGDINALQPHLNAVAVEFDFVDPIAPGRRALHRGP